MYYIISKVNPKYLDSSKDILDEVARRSKYHVRYAKQKDIPEESTNNYRVYLLYENLYICGLSSYHYNLLL